MMCNLIGCLYSRKRTGPVVDVCFAFLCVGLLLLRRNEVDEVVCLFSSSFYLFFLPDFFLWPHRKQLFGLSDGLPGRSRAALSSCCETIGLPGAGGCSQP